MEFTHSKQGIFIIADDLGLAKSINEGIFFAFKNGLISGASLMANGEAFDDAVEKIKSFPDTNIGIHFVLVEEKPLALKSLSKNHKIFFIKYILGQVNLKDIEKELRAQLNKCVQAGIKPSFINSHQHLHLLPAIANVVIKLAKEFNISYIRIVKEPLFSGGGKLFRRAQLLFLNYLAGLVKNKIRKAGLKSNDYFVGFINAGNLSKNDISLAIKLQSKHLDKIIELGCHPGFESEELKKKYKQWGNYSWEKELNLLKDLVPR